MNAENYLACEPSCERRMIIRNERYTIYVGIK